MEPRTPKPTTVDDYIAGAPAAVRDILTQIRAEIRRRAPQAAETMKYGMPAYVLSRDLLYFGAFKSHIGLFPPAREAAFLGETAPYRGEKGNLKFPLDRPIPYELIGRIAEARVKAALKAG